MLYCYRQIFTDTSTFTVTCTELG
uniref:Uncharacterized protein n=1 Tax=Anguilla anguilla TaxID=7936 RepID=A0A0E9VY05_ANGAN